MAGKSRLSEQESGFKTAERKGIRLSGPLSQKNQGRVGTGDGERIRGEKQKVWWERGRVKARGGGGAW